MFTGYFMVNSIVAFSPLFIYLFCGERKDFHCFLSKILLICDFMCIFP